MTVNEMIKVLQTLPQDMEVLKYDSNQEYKLMYQKVDLWKPFIIKFASEVVKGRIEYYVDHQSGTKHLLVL